jgi:hypothetical protein
LFRGGGNIKLDVFFPAEKAVDACREVVDSTTYHTMMYGGRNPASCQKLERNMLHYFLLFNSVTAIGGHDRQLFDKLLW